MNLQQLKESTPDRDWKFVPDWENKYAVSNLGDLYSFSLTSGGFKKPLKVKNGYFQFKMFEANRQCTLTMSLVVAKLFVENKNNYHFVWHKNGDKSNYTADNLVWRFSNYKYDEQQRFFKNVKKTNTCWNWIGAIDMGGYGTYSKSSKKIKASRFSYEMHIGKIPAGLFVCHTCDNPKCVNPDHLFLGTAKDNYDDAVKKGRAKYGIKGGVIGPSWRRSTTDEVARKIKSELSTGKRCAEIARQFGVTPRVVVGIKDGTSYKYI